MKRGGCVAFWLALTPVTAAAEGPPLAHLTLDGTTITLTAHGTDADLPDQTTGIPSGETTLHFAQLHLGFPMPPFLTVGFQYDDDALTLTELTLLRTSTSHPTVFAPTALSVDTGSTSASGPTIVIAGEGLIPTGQLLPLHLEIVLQSP